MSAAEWGLERRARFLGSVPLFRDLPAELARTVAQNFGVKTVERGGFVFLEGDRATSLNVLAAGRVKVVRETDEGREVILRQIDPGEIFGGAGGWGSATYPASARAQEHSVVLRLPAERFTALIREQPDFALAVVAELGRRLRETESRIRDLQSERAERRIARALLRLASKTGVHGAEGIEVGVALTRQDLAELGRHHAQYGQSDAECLGSAGHRRQPSRARHDPAAGSARRDRRRPAARHVVNAVCARAKTAGARCAMLCHVHSNEMMNAANSLVRLDVSDLEPPEPMVRILQTAATLAGQQTLLVDHHRRPVYLYPQLEAQGFAHETRELGPGHVQIRIWRKEVPV